MPQLGQYSAIHAAYSELSTERQIGMSVGPIPMSKVVEYLERFNLPHWWASVISAADQAYLKLLSDEMSKNSAA